MIERRIMSSSSGNFRLSRRWGGLDLGRGAEVMIVLGSCFGETPMGLSEHAGIRRNALAGFRPTRFPGISRSPPGERLAKRATPAGPWGSVSRPGMRGPSASRNSTPVSRGGSTMCAMRTPGGCAPGYWSPSVGGRTVGVGVGATASNPPFPISRHTRPRLTACPWRLTQAP